MDIKQIRKTNLYLLKEEAKSWAEIARRAGTDPAYISQIVSKKAVREIGDDLARKLEAGFYKPHGWMDHPHHLVCESNATDSEYQLVEAESDDWDKTEFAFLDKLDVRVRGGHGEAGGIEVVQKRLPFLRSTLRAAGVPAEAAKLVELSGNSMEPWGFHGDVVGVNTLDRGPIKDGKIYAFRDFDMMRVKILERRPGGGLRIRSYNSDEYPPEDLTADEVAQRIEIVGRVFWRSSVDY